VIRIGGDQGLLIDLPGWTSAQKKAWLIDQSPCGKKQAKISG
jgi:hypothetical protein